jgi:F-type H+-transporting ATPase subunit epsilon
MRLRVLLPVDILYDGHIAKITAEALDGSFTLLPHHIDVVAALVPGLMSYTTDGGTEEFLAVGEGILVKTGDRVLVSVANGMRGPDLGSLERVMRGEFNKLTELDLRARSALSRLQADIVRRHLGLEGYGA